MAYGNGFPIGYQPAYYPQQNLQYQTPNMSQVQPPAVNQNNGIIWVQGEAGAKSYLVAPNNTVQLWDSEEQVIYLKSADASGMPSMKILDYTIRESSAPAVASSVTRNNDMYVTKEELRAFKESLEDRFKSLTDRGGKDE